MDLRTQNEIELQIQEREKFISDLTREKQSLYKSVQDFTKADAVTTDKAMERMRKIDIIIKAHRREIELRQGKLKLARRAKQD